MSTSNSNPAIEVFPAKEVALGELPVIRALPTRGKRMVGPWCFIDRFGPMSFAADKPMDVAPHPHIGLQTVTWLLDGEVRHDDSIGSALMVRPGDVNVMTSGRGIAHAEQTPPDNSGKLNGVQLWVALPDAVRNGDPLFDHVQRVPIVDVGGGVMQVFSGELAGVSSPARHFSSIVGADLDVQANGRAEFALDPRFEHCVLLLGGDCSLNGRPLEERQLYYLSPGHASADIASRRGARLLLLGGAPFGEQILMWWNFVARTPDEIEIARANWEAHEGFGEVANYAGPRLAAPPLLKLAKPQIPPL